MVSAGTRLTSEARSGVNSATSASTSPSPSTYSAGRVRPSSNSVWSMASTTHASVPGRTKWWAVATLAVSVRRGSKTTISPSRFFRSRSRFGKSGTVIREPFEAIGLAPKTRKYDVRSMSGIGNSSWCPYIRYARSWAGSWSTEVALNLFRVRKVLTIAGPWVIEPRLCTLGLPR